MIANIPRNQRKLFRFRMYGRWHRYNFVDTTAGQSRSPIMGMKPCEIIGVHTGGCDFQKENFGTYITPEKLEWIAEAIGSPWNIGVDRHLALYLLSLLSIFEPLISQEGCSIGYFTYNI